MSENYELIQTGDCGKGNTSVAAHKWRLSPFTPGYQPKVGDKTDCVVCGAEREVLSVSDAPARVCEDGSTLSQPCVFRVTIP